MKMGLAVYLRRAVPATALAQRIGLYGIASRLWERSHVATFSRRGSANGVELEAAKQIACEQEQKRSQQSLKAVVGDHGYRGIGISNQKREDRKKDCKDKGHLRWCCQIHALSPKKTSAERRSARPPGETM